MANIHGKNALIYLAPGSGAAIALTEQGEYSLELDFDQAETTELGDSWATFVKGVQRWSGSVSGNFDTASKTLWLASVAEVPCNFYLYPQRSVLTQYYYGTAWVKLGTIIAGGVSDKAKSSVNLQGDSALSIMP